MIEEKDIAIIIPSKGRPETVPTMLGMFPTARYCISESEVDEYEIKNKNNLLIHPDDLVGLTPKRQWILDNVDARVVFQSDDDIEKVLSLVGMRSRHISDPRAIMQIIVNTANIADGIGAKLYGYTVIANPMYSQDNKPFAFTSMIAGCFGIIDHALSYDQKLTTRQDVDMTLQGLAKFRVNLMDTRFCFKGKDFDNRGGLQGVRTKENVERDTLYMKAKWGSHVKWSGGAKGNSPFSKRNHININVTR